MVCAKIGHDRMPHPIFVPRANGCDASGFIESRGVCHNLGQSLTISRPRWGFIDTHGGFTGITSTTNGHAECTASERAQILRRLESLLTLTPPPAESQSAR